MSRESSEISEESKLPEYQDEVVSSSSINYLDGALEKSLRLIVELPEVAEDKAFTEKENEEQLTEVRSRKLTERGRSYQIEIKVKSFKSKRSTFTGTLGKHCCFVDTAMNYRFGSKNLVRLKFCGMNLPMCIMKSEKSFKTTS